MVTPHTLTPMVDPLWDQITGQVYMPWVTWLCERSLMGPDNRPGIYAMVTWLWEIPYGTRQQAKYISHGHVTVWEIPYGIRQQAKNIFHGSRDCERSLMGPDNRPSIYALGHVTVWEIPYGTRQQAKYICHGHVTVWEIPYGTRQQAKYICHGHVTVWEIPYGTRQQDKYIWPGSRDCVRDPLWNQTTGQVCMLWSHGFVWEITYGKYKE